MLSSSLLTLLHTDLLPTLRTSPSPPQPPFTPSSLRALQGDLRILDARMTLNIADTRRMFEMLELRLRINRQIELAWGVLAPVRRVPPEVLLMVFEEVLLDTANKSDEKEKKRYTELQRLSLVSVHWAKVARALL